MAKETPKAPAKTGGAFKLSVHVAEPTSKRGFRLLGTRVVSNDTADALTAAAELVGGATDEQRANVVRITLERQGVKSGGGFDWEKEYKPRGKAAKK